MKRIFALGLLLGLLAAAGCAAADVVSASTATDLCPHTSTRPVYYFDHPEYVALNDFSHAVRGSAVVNTVCRDCGEVIRSEKQQNAELIRSHSFKKGKCLLCGRTEPDPKAPEPEALTVTTVPEETLNDGQEETEIRQEGGDISLVIPKAVKDGIRQRGGALTTEILEEEDGIYAALKVGEESLPADGISLRIYGRKLTSVLFVSTEEHRTEEEKAVWTGNDEPDGYCTVQWLGNGYYRFNE